MTDFEEGTFAKWDVQGTAFGKAPAKIAGRQHPDMVHGYQGQFLADSWPDRAKGKLTSKPFAIERPIVSFLIGGGNHPGLTCVNLVERQSGPYGHRETPRLLRP